MYSPLPNANYSCTIVLLSTGNPAVYDLDPLTVSIANRGPWRRFCAEVDCRR